MDTNKLKKFATEARTVLNQGVAQRFITLGFNPDGTVTACRIYSLQKVSLV